ncbi:hypothetical protein DYB26_003869 [Aphanomyces astaci]|uniref:PPM-type phosphatase domain-containing protein n=1 Tax=Aphanomyces astaci TaxID=112090 RepID=A0A418FWR4_APHAT|nr:hypothetical protein DYB26_003869 [Aphanomyces astaci]
MVLEAYHICTDRLAEASKSHGLTYFLYRLATQLERSVRGAFASLLYCNDKSMGRKGNKELLEENAVLEAQVAKLEVELQAKHDFNHKLQYESQCLSEMLARLGDKEALAVAKQGAMGHVFLDKGALQQDATKRHVEVGTNRNRVLHGITRTLKTLNRSIADLEMEAREYDRLSAFESELVQRHAWLKAECDAVELKHKAELQARKVEEYNRKRMMDEDAHLTLPLTDDCLLIGVFDGHGAELGQIASRAAKAFFASSFQDPALLDEVLESPEATFRRLFRECHHHLYGRFKSFYTAQGCSIREESGPFLTYRMANQSQPFRCVYGGTTATLALLHNQRVIVASVGDSAAILANPTGTCDLTWHAYCDSAPTPASSLPNDDDDDSKQTDNQMDDIVPSFVFLTGTHAPDCTSEFNRLAELGLGAQCQFDHATDPQDRVPIFIPAARRPVNPVRIHTPHCIKDAPPRGGYVKNARNEWACVVSAPPHAAFPDTLACTRSLGDFHMHMYGVTYEPDVAETNVEPGATLLLATDGVWDVWQFKQVASYIQRNNHRGTMLHEFMQANVARATELFGDHADNMTAVCAAYKKKASNFVDE